MGRRLTTLWERLSKIDSSPRRIQAPDRYTVTHRVMSMTLSLCCVQLLSYYRSDGGTFQPALQRCDRNQIVLMANPWRQTLKMEVNAEAADESSVRPHEGLGRLTRRPRNNDAPATCPRDGGWLSTFVTRSSLRIRVNQLKTRCYRN